jgi:site-specific recombinase XerD
MARFPEVDQRNGHARGGADRGQSTTGNRAFPVTHSFSTEDGWATLQLFPPALSGDVGADELVELEQLLDQVRDYTAAAAAPRTRRAYANDWRDFLAFCRERGFMALPARPETVAVYLASRAHTRKAATLARRLVAIARAHEASGYDSPTRSLRVRLAWAGIRRTHGTAQQGKAALLVEDLRTVVEDLQPPRGHPWPLAALRDRALLLVGFAGAFRRLELVGLDVEHLTFSRAGVAIQLPRSKTDQEGQGRVVGIPVGRRAETCPVRALRAWLDAAGISSGPVFRRVDQLGRVGSQRLYDRSVARIVKHRVAAAGLDPEAFAGHSLRSGFATSAIRAGVTEDRAMRQTRHRSVTVFRAYVQQAQLFADNAAGDVGL